MNRLRKTLKRYLSLGIAGLLSGAVAAQTLSTDSSRVSAEMHNAMVAALEQQKPGLGMRVLAVEDGQHVLAGGNGRYIIKGVLQDLWNGVERTGSVEERLPVLPPMLKPERFFVTIGNPNGEPVKVFIKSNCTMCDSVFAVLSSPIYRDKYQFNVMLLGNDKQSTAASKFVYCAKAPEEALEQLLSNPLRKLEFTGDCEVDTPNLTTKAAMAMNVRALPMMHFTQRTLSVIGDPSAML